MAEVLEPAGRGVASVAGEAASLSSVLGEVLEPLDGGVTSMAGEATSMAGKAASIAQFRIFVTTVYFFCWNHHKFLLPSIFWVCLNQPPIL